MELTVYDETKTSTIKLTDGECVDLNELLTGVLATRQDYTILGIRPERFREIKDDCSRLLGLGQHLEYRNGTDDSPGKTNG